MRFLKTMIVTVFMLTAVFFAAGTVQAAEVNSDEELLSALRDESVSSITINYRNVNIREFVTVNRNLTINGKGAVLTARNGACLTFGQSSSLILSDITLTGESDFAIKTYGNAELVGTVEFAEGYGILLGSGSSLNSSANLVSRTGNKIAIGVNTNGGSVTVGNVNISDTTTSGVLLYIYRGQGTLNFSGTNTFKSTYGSAVLSASGGKDVQKIVISAHASVTAEAANSKDSGNFGAAFNIRECSLEMKKGSELAAKGSFGAVYCDTLITEESCAIKAENTVYSADSGAVTVFGKTAPAATVSVGEKNTLNLSGRNGFIIYGCQSTLIGKGSTLNINAGAGVSLSSIGGKIEFADNVAVNSFADGSGIYAKSGFTCGANCDITLSSVSAVPKRGINSGSGITIGGYSVIKCKTADIAMEAKESVVFGDYATFDCENVGSGIASVKGTQTGKGCMISIKDAGRYGIYSTGTMLADTLNFGEENTVNITSDGIALYAAEAVIFNKGCNAELQCSSRYPVIMIDTTLTTQGYFRVTGSAINVKSGLSADSGSAAVNVVGSVIVEDGGRLSIESKGGFGILCRAGDLIIATKSTVNAEGGCAVFVEDGNVRISQGGSLGAKGLMDSGIRVRKGMLRVSEDSTVISEGERFGAEILVSGGIWLDDPKYFDLRSTKSNAIFIESGVFNTQNTETLSAWYRAEGKQNTETWWSADVSGMKAWEINSKLSSSDLCYADYSQHNASGTARFEDGREMSSEGFSANIGTFSAGNATRISSFKTRPVSAPNYLFIPSGRSFSWKLEAESVEGEGEVFELISEPSSGTVSLTKSGMLTYAAPQSTRGEQVISYMVTAKDGAQSLPVEVIINVTRSKPPAAHNHTFDVQANGSLMTELSVTDFDGVIASLDIVEQPKHGKVSVGSDGRMIYTPEGSYVGLDSFRYSAADNDSDHSNEAVVTLLIGIKGETSARNNTYIAAKNEETSGSFEFSLAKGEELSVIEITTEPHYGTLVTEGTGFVYTPPENFAGTETFGYTVVTANGIKSNEAYISIITVPSEKPKANALKIDCASGKGYSGKLSAEDLDGKISTYMIETYPQNGTLELDASNGKYTYTANGDFVGADSFTFYVYDDEGLKSEIATVSISVDTYLNMLKAGGQLTKIVVISVIALAAVIVLVVIIVTGTIRKRRRQDMEYEEQYGNPYDDYYGY